MDTSRETLPELFGGSTFIFVGKVVRPKSANVRLLAEAANASTVLVDQVIQATPVMRGLTQHEVTLVGDHDGLDAPEQGQPFLFFTNGLVYGEAVAVREVGRLAPSSEALREVAALMQRAGDRPLIERTATAALIVTGRVVGLRPAERRAAPASEHDPDWWIATVLVLSVIRGGKQAKDVEVVFANSRDIAWYKSPKLHAGDSGIFLLHKPADSKEGAVSTGRYEVTDGLDFLPADQLGAVKSAIEKGRD